MSAAHHLNPNQLRMFMTPREIESEYRPGDFDANNAEKGWAYKKQDAEQPHRWGSPSTGTLAQSIRREGVQHPISLTTVADKWGGSKYINDGHHRLSIAREQPDQYVPVSHKFVGLT